MKLKEAFENILHMNNALSDLNDFKQEAIKLIIILNS